MTNDRCLGRGWWQGQCRAPTAVRSVPLAWPGNIRCAIILTPRMSDSYYCCSITEKSKANTLSNHYCVVWRKGRSQVAQRASS